MSSKIYLSVFIIFLSVVFLYFFVYQKYQDLSFLKKQLNQKEQELENTKRYIRQLKGAAEKLKEYPEELSIIETALPENLQEPETFYLLQTLCVESGVTLKNIGKFTSKGGDLPKRWEIDISLLANYQAFKNFLFNLEKSSRIIKVAKISFGGREGQGEKEGELYDINLTLIFHTY